jgi:hypothetical protein
MIEQIRRRTPSPAMVVACLALALSLGGTGYAVTSLPKGSVGAPQLRHNAVVSAKVKDGTLRAADFAAGQLPAGQQGPQGLQGPAGPAGKDGAPGPQGKQGAPGLSDYQVVIPNPTFVGTGSTAVAFAQCPAGKKPVGGGGDITASTNDHVAITGSFAVPDGWEVIAEEMAPTTSNWYLHPVAVCATVAP